MSLSSKTSSEVAILLSGDLHETVMHSINCGVIYPKNYSPYGHHPTAQKLPGLLGYNGELPDSMTGHYLLGRGNRAYNPVLMRFNSPDRLSPFGEGGFNAYAYCDNDPMNHTDPSGSVKLHFFARRLFNQSDVPNALSRVNKTLASVKKAEAKAPPAPKKTTKRAAKNSAVQSQGATAPAIYKSPTRDRNTLTPLSAHVLGETNFVKPSVPANSIAVKPIRNFAPASAWEVQLIAGPLRPIHNFAVPNQWKVILAPNPVQPFVRLIRNEV